MHKNQIKSLLGELYPASNELFPTLSNSIAIIHTKDKGRHLIASESLPAGSLILVELPIAHCLHEDSTNAFCQRCLHKLKVEPAPIRCEKDITCKVLYCSTVCRYKDLLYPHQFECSHLRHLLQQQPSNNLSELLVPIRLSLRVSKSRILQARPIRPCEEQYLPTQMLTRDDYFSLVESYVSHDKAYTDTDQTQFTDLANQVVQCLALNSNYFKEKDWPPNVSENDRQDRFHRYLLNSMKRYTCNHFQFSLMQHKQCRVSGVYGLATLLNHSCQPNLDIVFSQGGLLECRTIRKVHSGEELNNCYGPMVGLMSTNIRQQKLLDEFHFICECRACQSKEIKDVESQWAAVRCSACATQMLQSKDVPSLWFCAACESHATKERYQLQVNTFERLLSDTDLNFEENKRLEDAKKDELLNLFKELERCHCQANKSVNGLRLQLATLLSNRKQCVEAVRLTEKHAAICKLIYGSTSLSYSMALLELALALKRTKNAHFLSVSTILLKIQMHHYGVNHVQHIYEGSHLSFLTDLLKVIKHKTHKNEKDSLVKI